MINPVLNLTQLKSIIVLIFRGTALKVDRILKNTGIHKKSCWVCYWNGSQRWSTFISKNELQLAFWRWLSTIRILELNHNDRLCVSSAIYVILQPGDSVFTRKSPNMGIVIDKRISTKSKYPEILVEWGDIEPRWESAVCLEVF